MKDCPDCKLLRIALIECRDALSASFRAINISGSEAIDALESELLLAGIPNGFGKRAGEVLEATK